MLLLLSGDIECNPGPKIDDQPSYPLLIDWLEPLVNWQLFGLCLVGMNEHDILKIERENSTIENKKLGLYIKWLSVNPIATWRNVIDALTSIKENKLAQDIESQIDNDALSTESSLLPRTSNSHGKLDLNTITNW